MSTEITEDECKFCNPVLKKDYDLNIVCDKYIEYVKIEIPFKIRELLINIFRSDKYYLPPEIVSIIFKYLETEKTNKISKINMSSVLHFGKCESCSIKLLKYYEENLCHIHSIPLCVFPENF
tara:strand:+ start:29 stop:394 length:366 start_codon:yes stop_codon:yes gene_type:complete